MMCVMVNSRERMIAGAALTLGERGVEGASFSEVLARSGAPRGSIYHHFPGGKAQLATEATAYAGDWITELIERAAGPVELIRELTALWVGMFERSGGRAGCTVAAAAMAGDEFVTARERAGVVLRGWCDVLAARMREQGVAAARARAFATLGVAAFEGALVLARAEGDARPVRLAGRELERQAQALISARPAP